MFTYPVRISPVAGDARAAATKAFLRGNRAVWPHLPRPVLATRAARAYGRRLQKIARSTSPREQNPRTYFLRSRPELAVVTHLLNDHSSDTPVKITVLGCSFGAESYSILSSIKDAHPDLAVEMRGFDIFPEAVDVASEGLWDPQADQLELMTPAEIGVFFDREGSMLRVKDWLRKSVSFQVGDATDPALIAALGPQDLVFANRFLCHMQPADADRALRCFSDLVAPGGYLVCTGVDVDVRTRVMESLGWSPIIDRIAEIHNGDRTQLDSWPFEYWALEPFDKKQSDWPLRYATIFQRPASDTDS